MKRVAEILLAIIIALLLSSCLDLPDPVTFTGEDMTDHEFDAGMAWTDTAYKAPGCRISTRGHTYRKCTVEELRQVLNGWIGKRVKTDDRDRNCYQIANNMQAFAQSYLGNIAFGVINYITEDGEHRGCILITGGDDLYHIVNWEYESTGTFITGITFVKWNPRWVLGSIDI